jgi:hypothetical protein
MNFKRATDEMLVHPTLQDLADMLDVSVQSVRQARADESSRGFRAPPPRWERAVLSLTENTIAHYEGLARKLRMKLGEPIKRRV